MLSGKKILIGVTGSIAAYKAILLVRLLVKANAEVKVIMTPASKDFVSALTLSTLSKNPVLFDLFEENSWSNHVMLGRWADIMIVAPLSCNTLAKMANGFCDNLLLAVYLSAACPVFVAPAMDEDMWHHISTKENLLKIEKAGNRIINVGNGELASGLHGEGRMAEPEDIVVELENFFSNSCRMRGKRALVTAGPTHELIDPVRFISNYSSGKMGIAIAEALQQNGAEVRLILGPTSIGSSIKDTVHVTSADEMYVAVMKDIVSFDIIIMAAAVADYKVNMPANEKIKKGDEEFIELKLSKTRDILKAIGEIKGEDQVLVGFALETNNEKENALKKLRAKKLDMIVLNSLQDKGAGFSKDSNKITIFDKRGNEFPFQAKSKKQVANDIITTIIQFQNA